MWAEPMGRAPPTAPPWCHGAAVGAGQRQDIHLAGRQDPRPALAQVDR